MLFNFLTARFMREKKNWDAATSSSPVLLTTISKVCETNAVHRAFTLLSRLAEEERRGVKEDEGDWGVGKYATSGVSAI
jgi:hypothetical protein